MHDAFAHISLKSKCGKVPVGQAGENGDGQKFRPRIGVFDCFARSAHHRGAA